MKLISTIMVSLSSLLLLSVLICGLWIRTQKAALAIPEDAVNFHINLGVATVVITLLTIGMLFFKFVRN
ncbi:hypothetical protein [Desulfosporosinus sp.]|uniref:hypothetical protein n=1 Tax=Desulfosporosinus sp. TaxID=157907 RepID=UPI0025BFCF1A|nr:hypothetical protein [Desulfosporosinus sp.]MBC2723058.1 hypothetical protein [Desulfosporosinus sp.]MBC2728991.1 hypothetical protein [Desulfosporosinus sp.]